MREGLDRAGKGMQSCGVSMMGCGCLITLVLFMGILLLALAGGT